MDFNILSKIQFQIKQIWCKIKSIEVSQGIQSIIAGTNVTVDNTDPLNPRVSATGGGGSIDQDNIPRLIVDIPFSDLNIPEDSTQEEIDQAFANYIEDLQPDVDDTTIPFYRLRDVPGGDSGSGGDLTLEQARKNGNVLEGNIFGNAEFNKQGDRLAFAQLSDVYDANSYSTEEIKTGGTWIDAKPIYRRVYTGTTNEDSTNTLINITELNIDNHFIREAYFTEDGEKYKNEIMVYTDPTSINTEIRKVISTNTSIIIQRYNKYVNIPNNTVSEVPIVVDYELVFEYTKL